MAVVTLSGQIGAGARETGRLAAQRLGLEYVDQEILVEAARALGVPVEAVVGLDERTAGFGERLALTLRRFLERSAAAGTTDPMLGTGGLDVVLGRSYAEAAGEGPPEVSGERYLSTLAAVIRDLAAHDNVLIVGRGSQVILKDWPGAVHVLLVAPKQWRIEELTRREGLSTEQAEKRRHDSDKGRLAFHRKFFHIEADDPTHYHLTLNAERLSNEDAAALIEAAAKASVIETSRD